MDWLLNEIRAIGFIAIGAVILFGGMMMSDLFTDTADKVFKRKKSTDESR